MSILRDFRRAADAIERVAATLMAAANRHEDTAALTARLDELERERTMWQADVEALLMKAEGKLKAAANAEARERTMQKRADDIDPFSDPGEEIQAPIQESDAALGYPEEVLPLRMDVAPESKKASALRYKFS